MNTIIATIKKEIEKKEWDFNYHNQQAEAARLSLEALEMELKELEALTGTLTTVNIKHN